MFFLQISRRLQRLGDDMNPPSSPDPVVQAIADAFNEYEQAEKKAAAAAGAGAIQMDQGVANITRLFEQGQEVIINIFSTSVYNTLNLYADATLMLIMVVLFFVLWMITNTVVRNWVIPKLTELTLPREKAKRWRDVLLRIDNFFTMLLMFVVFQFIANQLTQGWISSTPDGGESIVGSVVVALFVFSILSLINSY